jgi:cell wall assembly regulator SMI1
MKPTKTTLIANDPLVAALTDKKGNLLLALKAVGAKVGKSKLGLRSIDLSATRVGNDGLACLSKQVALKEFIGSPLITDAGLEHAGRWRSVEHLDLSQSTIVRNGLSHLAGLTKLRSLWLLNCTLSDKALALLPALPALQSLDLAYAKGYTDRGLKVLTRLTGLTSLRIDQAPISGACLRHLKSLPRLADLSISGSENHGLTDAGLKHLPPLGLEHITLDRTAISDCAIEFIKRQSALVSLDVAYTNLTDNSIDSLGTFSTLERLDLCGTYVSKAGVEKLQALLPDCHVIARDLRGRPKTKPKGAKLIERPERRKPAPVAQSWRRLEIWFEQYFPAIYQSLRPPAKRSDLARLEKRFGELPRDVVDSYLIHDGQDPDAWAPGLVFGISIDPLERVLGIAQRRERPEPEDWWDSFTIYPPDTIDVAPYSPRRIPLHWDGGRNHLGIDLEPGPKGAVGQVIPYGIDDHFRPVLAVSWAHFLEDLADELEAGHAAIENPALTDNPFTLKGADGVSWYKAWAKAKLPLAFQNGEQ